MRSFRDGIFYSKSRSKSALRGASEMSAFTSSTELRKAEIVEILNSKARFLQAVFLVWQILGVGDS